MWGGGEERGLLQRKTAGNDKGCKYLPLPGPGSCAELTGPLLGCWKVGGGVTWLARWAPVGKRERKKTEVRGVAKVGGAQQITQRL